MASQEEWVEVLVPKQLVPDVYGLIAQRMSQGFANTSVTVDEELIDRMYRESPPAMRKFLELLADRPGADLTTAELSKAMIITPAQLAGVLGAFGRRRKNRYKGAKKPFSARWDHALHTWTYQMDADAAGRIKKAALVAAGN